MNDNTPKIKGFFKKEWVKEQIKNIWDLIKFASLALIIVIPIRTYIAQPFIVSGESMYPTFENGQYLIVDEISYRMGHIKRGDVVIFKYPHDPSRYFIKRIIGLPNENITISNHTVTIKNEKYPEGFTLDEPYINELFVTNGEYQTKDGEYFVMGDNRNRSSDSRIWGVVDKKFLIGRALVRLLPVGTIDYLPGEYKEEK